MYTNQQNIVNNSINNLYVYNIEQKKFFIHNEKNNFIENIEKKNYFCNIKKIKYFYLCIIFDCYSYDNIKKQFNIVIKIKKNIQLKDKIYECSICLNTIDFTELVKICDNEHYLHLLCLEKYKLISLYNYYICPLCRYKNFYYISYNDLNESYLDEINNIV